jgi:hypothetical protein
VLQTTPNARKDVLQEIFPGDIRENNGTKRGGKHCCPNTLNASPNDDMVQGLRQGTPQRTCKEKDKTSGENNDRIENIRARFSVV